MQTEFVTIETDKQMKISKVTHGALRQLTVVVEFGGPKGGGTAPCRDCVVFIYTKCRKCTIFSFREVLS